MMMFVDQICRLGYVDRMDRVFFLLPIVSVVIREHPSMPKERWEKINCWCSCCCYANGKATSFAFFLVWVSIILSIYVYIMNICVCIEQNDKCLCNDKYITAYVLVSSINIDDNRTANGFSAFEGYN